MVKVFVATNMIKNAVAIMASMETTTKVAAKYEKETAPSTDVPEFEACTCGGTKCCMIDEPTERAASSPSTPTQGAEPNECGESDDTPMIENVDPLEVPVKNQDEKLVVMPAKDTNENDDEEQVASEDDDQVNKSIEALYDADHYVHGASCHGHGVSVVETMEPDADSPVATLGRPSDPTNSMANAFVAAIKTALVNLQQRAVKSVTLVAAPMVAWTAWISTRWMKHAKLLL